MKKLFVGLIILSVVMIQPNNILGNDTQLLWPHGAPGAKGNEAKDKPTIKCYWPKKRNKKMPAVLLFPGGGYKHHSAAGTYPKELNALGIAVFYIKYRLPTAGYPQPYPLRDAQRALSLVRSKAKQWNLDESKIGVLGFSSGGHVASSLSTHYTLDNNDRTDEVDKVSCKPDFTILYCPVITMKQHAHRPSVVRLLGKTPRQKLIDYYSNEGQVNSQTPPAFLVHASDDKLVKPENSQLYYAACKKNKVNGKLLIYKDKCGHGVGKKVDFWRQPLKYWLVEIKVID